MNVKFYRDWANAKLPVGDFPYKYIMALCDEVERLQTVPTEPDSQVECYRGLAERGEEFDNFAANAVIALCGKIDRLNRVLAVTTDPQYSQDSEGQAQRLIVDFLAWSQKHRHVSTAWGEFDDLVQRLIALSGVELKPDAPSTPPAPLTVTSDQRQAAEKLMEQVREDMAVHMVTAVQARAAKSDGTAYIHEQDAKRLAEQYNFGLNLLKSLGLV